MSDNASELFGGTHPTIYHPFVSSLMPDLKNKTIVDIGCGRGIWGFIMRFQRDVTGARMVGLDLNDVYIAFAKKHNIYDEIIKTDITQRLPFDDKSVDFLIASELIEHIYKEQGQKLLDEIDRIMKPGGRAIVTTPNVWIEMPHDEPKDRHYSLWSATDFRQHDYKVNGIGVKLPFNNPGPLQPVVHALYFIGTPFAYLIPEISGLLMAHKDYK